MRRAAAALAALAVWGAEPAACAFLPTVCPAGYQAYLSRCYGYSGNTATLIWSDADAYCVARGGRLVSAHNANEATFAGNLCTVSGATCWIGLYQTQGQTNLQGQWSDGTKWYATNSVTVPLYNNFATGQPDGGASQDCVSVWGLTPNGAVRSWQDASCNNKYPALCSQLALCPKGSYSSGPYAGWDSVYGQCDQCPAGTFNPSDTLTGASVCQVCTAGLMGAAGRTAQCSTSCPQGYWCPAGTDDAAAVNSATGKRTCPTGTYGASAGLGSADQCKQCAPGYYCPAGVVKTSPTHLPCNAGTCGFIKQDTATCSQSCPAGFVCGAGTACPNALTEAGAAATNQAVACGGDSVFCPSGSKASTPVSTGYYTTGGISTRRTGQSICEPGFFCAAGVRSQCPGGSYVATAGSTSSASCSPCSAGYLCPTSQINTSPRSLNCYDRATVVALGASFAAAVDSPAMVFCPAASAQPQLVQSGYFSGPTEDARLRTREYQSQCDISVVCVGGLRKPLIAYKTGNQCGVTGAFALTVLEMAAAGVPVGTGTFDALVDSSRAASYNVKYAVSQFQFSDPSKPACQLPEPQLVKGAIQRRVTLKQDWAVSFYATVFKSNGGNWGSLFHVGATDGERSPAVWVSPTGYAGLASSLYYVVSNGKDCAAAVPLGVEVFVQMQSAGGVFSVLHNGMLVCSLTMTSAAPWVVLADRPVYVADPWHEPAFASLDGPYFQNLTLAAATGRRLDSSAWFAPRELLVTPRGLAFHEQEFAIWAEEPEQHSRSLLDVSRNEGIFAYDAASGALTMARSDLNYEVCLPVTSMVYRLVLRAEARSKVGNELHASARCVITVSVDDDNDKPEFAQFDSGTGVTTATTVYHRQIVEKADKNVPVANCDAKGLAFACPASSIATAPQPNVLALDQDDGSVLAYSIVSGDDGYDANPASRPFKIDPCNGLVSAKFAGSIAYTTKQTYTYTIQAQDDGNGGRYASKTDTASLVIHVINVNDAPVVLPDPGTLTIKENAPESTPTVGMATATDDDGDAITFSIATNDADAFKIVGNQLMTTKTGADKIDFESSKKQYFIVIQASDGKGGVSSGTFVVKVADANDAPVFGSRTSFFVMENAAAGTAVCAAANVCTSPAGDAVATTDADQAAWPADVTAYSLSGAASAKFAIDAKTGIITVKAGAALNFEDETTALTSGTGRGFQLTVTATSPGFSADPTPRSSSVLVAVYVVDVNEAPVFPALAGLQVLEGWPVGYAVPGLFQATDPDNADLVLLGQPAQMQTLSCLAGGVANEYIGVETDTATGKCVLKVLKAINFEALSNPTLVVQVVAQDNGGPVRQTSAVASVNVAVRNRNDRPTWAASTVTVQAPENVPFTNGVITAADQDAGTTLSYQVIGGNGADMFEIVLSGTGFVARTRATVLGTTTPVVLDYEQNSKQWTLLVRVQDSGTSATIGNACDPVQDATSCGDGAVCLAGRCNERCYDTSTGAKASQVTRDALYRCDYTNKGTRVATIDGASTAIFSESADMSLVVQVNDANDAPQIQGCPMALVISYQLRDQTQNVTKANVIGGKTTDQDANAAFRRTPNTYSLMGFRSFLSIADAATPKARIVYAPGGADVLGAVGTTFSSILRVTDPAGLSSDCALQFTVIDLNTPPSLADVRLTAVSENSIGNTVTPVVLLQTLQSFVVDPDAGDKWTFSTTPNPFVLLDPATGQLTLGQAPLDFETLPNREFAMIVRVVDSRGAEDSATVTLPVTDVNEAPIFALVPQQTVNENQPAATVVVPALLATYTTDPDQLATDAKWRTLAFTLVACDANPDGSDCPFTVNAISGAVKTTRPFNFETSVSSWNVRVRATDGAGLSEETVIKVVTGDVPEAPVFKAATSTINVNEGGDPNAALFSMLMVVTDEDTVDTPSRITYTIVAGDTAGAFEIVNGDLKSKTGLALDYEAQQRYTLTIKATDSAALFAQGDVVVAVQNVNDVLITQVSTSTLACGGGTAVTLTGANLGLVGTSPATTLTVEYTSVVSGVTYRCVDPVKAGNTQITCKASAGVGAGFKWAVTVAVAGLQIMADKSPLLTTNAIAYSAPTITSVAGVDNAATQGGAVALIAGTCIGAAADYVGGFTNATMQSGVTYCNAQGLCYKPTVCSVSAPDKVSCTLLPGVGAGFKWTLKAMGLQSSSFSAGGYGAPTLSLASFTSFASTGAAFTTPLVLTGTNFGALNAVPNKAYAQLTVNRADGGLAVRAYLLQGCKVTTAYTKLTCTSIEAGAGNNLVVKVSFGQQENANSNVLVAFTAPIILSLDGEGVAKASTQGGQLVIVRGAGFGPACGRAASEPDASGKLGQDGVTCDILQTSYSRGGRRARDNSVIRYAPQCAVVTSSQINCVTLPGTGAGHSWTFDVGGHVITLTGRTSSYDSPTVGNYDGAGSHLALTQGAQDVVITGANFGPLDGARVVAYYGGELKPLEFGPQDCTVTLANEQVLCRTLAGAGMQLKWTLYVDDQQSITQTTDYGAPQVFSVAMNSAGLARGENASNLSNNGGQVLIITGKNFGPSFPSYLEQVAYGPAGNPQAYQPACEVLGHELIQCKTQAGVGSDLRWRVTVRGQQSAPNVAAVSAYEAPLIKAPASASGPSEGGFRLRVTAAGLAVCDPKATVQVKFGDLTVPFVDFYDEAVSKVRPAVLPAACPVSSTGNKSIEFFVPEMSGSAAQAISIVVTSKLFEQPLVSQTRPFLFDPPVIQAVYAEPIGTQLTTGNGGVGTSTCAASFRVTVRGLNFCKSNACCQVLLNGRADNFAELDHSHRTVTICTSEVGNVAVQCAGRTSNQVTFNAESPFIFQTSTSLNKALDQTQFPTRATQRDKIFIWGLYMGAAPPVVTIGGNNVAVESHEQLACDDPRIPANGFGNLMLLNTPCFKTTVAVPSGAGKRNELVAASASTLQKSQATRDFEFVVYQPPVLASVDFGFSGPAGPTIGGGKLTLKGSNLGGVVDDAAVSVFELVASSVFQSSFVEVGRVTCSSFDHETAVCAVPPGEGKNLALRVKVADQDTAAQDGQFTLSYLAPSVTAVTFANGSVGGNTEGGDLVTLAGSNFGRPFDINCASLGLPDCSPVQPRVAIGGLPCVFVSNSQSELKCRIPAGEGKGLPVVISVRSQEVDTGQRFSYAAPVVTSFTPLLANTDGLDLVTLQRDVFTIAGANFGVDRLTVWFTLDNVGATSRIAVASRDLGQQLNNFLGGTNHNRLAFYVPALRGKNIVVEVEVAGQTTAAAGTFSYNTPKVSTIATVDQNGTRRDWQAGSTTVIKDGLFPTAQPVAAPSPPPSPPPSANGPGRLLVATPDVLIMQQVVPANRSAPCQRSVLARGTSWRVVGLSIYASRYFERRAVVFADESCGKAVAVLVQSGEFRDNYDAAARLDVGCTTSFEQQVYDVTVTAVDAAGAEFLTSAGCCGRTWSDDQQAVSAATCLRNNECVALSRLPSVARATSGYGAYSMVQRSQLYMSGLYDSFEQLRAQGAVALRLPEIATATVTAADVFQAPTGPTSGCFELEAYGKFLERRRKAFADTGTAVGLYRKCLRKALMELDGENFSTNLFNASQQVRVFFFKDELSSNGTTARTQFEAATTSSAGGHPEPCAATDGCIHLDKKIVFQIPPGFGRNIRIMIRVGNQDAPALNPSSGEPTLFHYQEPTIDYVTPGSLFSGDGFVDAKGGLKASLRLVGTSFGGVPSPTSVLIGGRPCNGSSWYSGDSADQGEPYIGCTAAADVVGPKSVFVCVAGQANLIPASRLDAALLAEADRVQNDPASKSNNVSAARRVQALYLNTASRVNSRCKTDYDQFGRSSGYAGGLFQLCVPCPAGSICNVEETPFGPPSSNKGFYRLTLPSVDSATGKVSERAANRCPQELWNASLVQSYPDLVQGATCDDFVSCEPAEACVGANQCAKGYTYNLERCQAARAEPARNNSCGVTFDPFTSTFKGVDADCNPAPGTLCAPDRPWECSACVVSMSDSASMVGTCECETPKLCALCSVRTHFRLNNRCQGCPDNPVLVIVGFVLVVLSMVVGGYWLSKKNINLALFSIVLDFFQVLAVFSSVNIAWPQSLLALFRFMSVFNLNIDVAAPECLVPTLEFETKWWLMEALPVCVLGGTIVVFFCYAAVKLVTKGGDGETQLASHLPRLIAVFLLCMYVLYLNVTRKSLDVFNCNPLPLQSDGYTYTAFTSPSCDGGSLCRCGEGVQLRLQAPALICLLIYSVGFPIFVFAAIRNNKDAIMEDQFLRAAGVGNDRETNPRAYELRKKYSGLYMHFKPEHVTWIINVIARKFAVAAASLLFRANTTFQLSVVLIVLFTSFCLQLQYRPYLSTGERPLVLKQLDEKALRGLDLEEFKQFTDIQRRVQESVRIAKEQAKKDTKQFAAKAMWDKDGSMTRAASAAARERRAEELFFDYNTVDGVLIASSILICLGGVMFSSGQLSVKGTFWAVQNEFISYCIIITVVLTLLYIALVVTAEIFPTITHRSCTRCLQVLQRKRLDGGKGIDLDEDNLHLASNPMFPSGDDASPLRSEIDKTGAQLDRIARDNAELRKEIAQRKQKNQDGDFGSFGLRR
jgi:hypothetical protein